jgi:hypothetical protein
MRNGLTLAAWLLYSFGVWGARPPPGDAATISRKPKQFIQQTPRHTTMQPCLINQSTCGRVAGNPVCAKCGIDERVVYPGQADLELAVTSARARYWETHARDLEAQHSGELARRKPSPEISPPSSNSDLKPQAAWPFPTGTSQGGDTNHSPPKSGKTGGEIPKLLTAGAVSLAANAALGLEGAQRYAVSIFCFAVVYGVWTLLQQHDSQDK